MKPRLVDMFTIAKKFVLHQPATLTLVERNRATVHDGISIVLPDNLVKVVARFPLQHTRLGFVAYHERNIDPDSVLLETVNLHCGMIRGGAKLVSLREVRRINVCSRIDDERAPTR